MLERKKYCIQNSTSQKRSNREQLKKIEKTDIVTL